MRIKVVIIGHSYTSRLGIIRSLANLDCEITVVAMVFYGPFGRFLRGEIGKPIDCYSKFVYRVLYCRIQDEKGLINLLLKKCTSNDQKVVLIPDSDFSAAVIDKNLDRLKDRFICPNIKYEAGLVEHWMNKVVQKELAKQVGLNVAEGHVVRVQNKRFSIPSGIGYPCFTKALATISGGKQFLRKCDDEVALRRVLDRVAQKYDTQVLVEEYKRIDKEFAVVGFSDGNSVFIPGLIEFSVNSRSHFGIAREGKIRPVTGFDSIVLQFKTFVKQIGFCGLFDIDFYESDGELFFGEINLRFGGSGYSYTAMGVNIPAMYVQSLIGDSCTDFSKEVLSEARFINERMCLDDFVSGYLSKDEFSFLLASESIHFIYEQTDPGPQRSFVRYCHFMSMYKRIRRIRKSFKK